MKRMGEMGRSPALRSEGVGEHRASTYSVCSYPPTLSDFSGILSPPQKDRRGSAQGASHEPESAGTVDDRGGERKRIVSTSSRLSPLQESGQHARQRFRPFAVDGGRMCEHCRHATRNARRFTTIPIAYSSHG